MTHTIYMIFLLIFCKESSTFIFYSQENTVPLKNYDFIIVGSGSAGSVLANRLSEVPEWKVLLIEAGKRPNFISDIPAIAPTLQFTDYNWGYKMEKTPNVCLGMVDKQCPWPRGKGLGGSTLINYMIYTRGNREDYDRWSQQGNPGWSYDEVLPYFMKSERSTLKRQDPGYHNKYGLLSVEDVNYSTVIRESFIDAGKILGYPYVDYNGRTQDGFSYVQSNTLNGFRHSGYKAFIRPAESRPNLHVLTESRVTKVLIDPDKKQAYGVQIAKNKKYYMVNATKEVIISAGALISPQLLMLSGIGPENHLKAHNIDVIQNLRGVGQNLHDHITFIGLAFELNQTVSGDQNDIQNPILLLNWLLTGKGTFTTLGGVEALGYYHTNVSSDRRAPDIELLFIAGSLSTDNGLVYRKSFGVTDEIYDTVFKPLEGTHTWSIFPMLMHPKSIGHIELKSKNPFDWPKFYGNYLSDPQNLDIKAFTAGIREIIRLSETEPFKKYGSKLRDTPLPGCREKFNSDEYWECALRHLTPTLHHQVGTCKMGPANDPMAVVNNKGQVYGIKNLRVADTSVIPFALTAHTCAPAYMVGERISDFIKYDWDIQTYIQ